MLRLLHVQEGGQGGVGAGAVILAVAPHQAAVPAQVPGRPGRHHLEFGADQVLLLDAVMVFQVFQQVELDALLGLGVSQGQGPHQDIELFPFEGLGHLLVHGLLGQVGQEVQHGKDRVMGVLADGELHPGAVGLDDHPVDGQGPGQPLVFLDAAVVVGLQKGQVGVFIERVLFQVQPGRVDVGGHDAQPLGQGPAALDHQDDDLAPVIIITPGAGLLAGQVHKAQGLGLAFDLHHRLPFGLGPVQKSLVMVAVGEDGGPFGLIHLVPDHFGVDGQTVPQLFQFVLVLDLHTHFILPR